MKKKIIWIILMVMVLVLLVPIRRREGEITTDTALIYQVSQYPDGVTIEIFGREIYRNLPLKEEKAEAEGTISWEAISEDGVNEEVLWSQIDQELLTQIAIELQAVVREEMEEEKQNPNLVLEEGWIRVLQKEGYQQVVEMGKPAMKPLYWIIYKSENAGLYEYLCSLALYEISGFDMKKENGELTWSNSKEFLEKFNEQILERRPKDFTVENQNGERVQLSDFYGKPTLLVFWATWCGPCKEELPDLEAMYQKYGNEMNFVMVNVTTWREENDESVVNFIKENDYHFPVYLDTEGNAIETYQIQSIPQIFFLDKGGNLHKKYANQVEKETLEENIKEILEK